MEKIAQGAEAVIYRDADTIIKERFSKNYRLTQLDSSLRGFRTRREAKVMRKLEEMNFPAPRLRDFCDQRMIINMDFIEGKKVRDVLEENSEFQQVAQEIGKKVAQLHQQDIVHGDLTTSNMLLNNDNLTFIDFGLSAFSEKVEDKAVDLFLLDRALESKHYQLYPEIFAEVLAAYKESYPEAVAVLERFHQVQKRGRNKK